MFRTPAKEMTRRATTKSPESSPQEQGRATVAQARRSIEQRLDSSDEGRPTGPPALAKAKPGVVVAATGKARRPVTSGSPNKETEEEKSPRRPPTYASKTAEAKACLTKIKYQIGISRNLKTEIKTEVLEATDRLYRLVKEAEEGGSQGEIRTKQHLPTPQERKEENEKEQTRKLEGEVIKKLEEHKKLLQDSKDEMEKLNQELKIHREEMEKTKTYASVTAVKPKERDGEKVAALHSIAITSKNEKETGEEVYERIRKSVNARDEGIRIDRIRKAKDRKVIIGCGRKEEITKIKERIRKSGGDLEVEDIKNKDPLVILKSVLKCHTDDEIVKAIKTQNKALLEGIEEEGRMKIKFKKHARNPHTAHVVMQVSPKLWQRMMDVGAVHIDVQRVKVEDQSPLIQCSRCLGYGHGRRFCKETLDKCSHCGGPHLRKDCPLWMARDPPECSNCRKANYAETSHNAFSDGCPVRKRWEEMARSTTAYC